MAVIQLQSTRQVTSNSPDPATIQPTREVVDPMAAAFSSLSSASSQLLEGLAKQEEEHLQQMQQNQVFADVANLETERLARVAELQQTGTGDKPFTKAVMDDFNSRIEEVANTYSPFAKELFQKKILPLQEQVGKTALAVQISNDNQRIMNNLDTFNAGNYAAVNAGAKPLQQALTDADQVAETVPLGMREEMRQRGRQAAYSAELSGRISRASNSTDLNAGIEELNRIKQEISSGVYSEAGQELVSRSLNAVDNNIQSAIARKDQVWNKLGEMADKDPVAAQEQVAQLNGLPQMSRSENIKFQSKPRAEGGLGLHPADVRVVSQSEAENLVKDLSVLPDIGTAVAYVAEQNIKFEKEGLQWREVTDSIKRFKLDVNPAIFSMVEYASAPQNYKPEYGVALLNLVKNPNAADTARKNFDTKGVDTVARGEWEANIISKFDAEFEIAKSAQDGGAEWSKYAKNRLDVAYLLADQISSSKNGKLPDVEAVYKIMTPVVPTSSVRVENNDRYAVPLDKGQTPLTPDFMDALKSDVLNKGGIDYVPTYPSQKFTEDQIRKDAGWVNYGENAVALKVGGAIVLVNGEPVIEKFDSLSADVASWKEYQAKSNSPLQQQLRVRGQQTKFEPWSRPAKAPVTPAPKPAAKAGDIQFPAGVMLPPPSI